MSECIINLSPIDIQTRDRSIFYATDSFIIYREKSSIVLADCEMNILSAVPCPADCRNFECLDLGDAIIMVLSGKVVIIFDKYGADPIHYRLDQTKVGRVVSKLYATDNEDAIIFATKMNDQIQIVIYDFMDRKKLAQSTSWKVFNATDFVVFDNIAYCLLDSSFLVACDASTCEPLWTRFESGKILPSLLEHEGKLLYSYQGLIRLYRDKQVENIRIPLVHATHLLGVVGDDIFFTSDNAANINSYNIKEQRLNWHITGRDKINEALLIKGGVNGKIYNTAILRIANYIGVINLDLGKSSYYLQSNQAYRIRQTGDHILIHRRDYTTDMIPSMQEESDD